MKALILTGSGWKESPPPRYLAGGVVEGEWDDEVVI